MNMRRLVISITLKSTISLALCLTLVTQTQMRVAQAWVATAAGAAEIKNESQFRSEASRYDSAIRAIGGIATMKLETTDDLKRAVAILDRERSNLKLSFSKLVVLTISDSTFLAGLKKKAPDKPTAEAFLKLLNSDGRAVLKVDGAESLAARLRSSAQSDASILRRAGERLNEATAKIRRIGQGIRSPGFTHNGFKMGLVGYAKVEPPIPSPNAAIQVVEVVIGALFVGAFVLAVIAYGSFLLRVNDNRTGQELVACQEAADVGYTNCAAVADIFGLAGCYTKWLIAQAACLLAV